MVQIRYARSPTHAVKDYREAFDLAVATGNGRGAADLEALFLDFLLDDLGEQSPTAFEAYLRSRAVWREHDGWTVFRTTGSPCVAFTGYRDVNGDVGVLVLGFFTGRPGAELDAWWRDIVVPRLEAEK